MLSPLGPSARMSSLVTMVAVAVAGVAHAATVDRTAESRAQRLTNQAVEAGLNGDTQRRERLLQLAIATAPDFAPARWEAGQIRADERWLEVEEAQELAARDPRIAEYRALCAAGADTPAAHVGLARWCRRQQLPDEARYHWLSVLRADADNKEALKALDVVWYEDQLVKPEEADRLKEESRREDRAQDEWRSRVAGWTKAMSDGEAAAEAALYDVRRIEDAAAIEPFERLASGAEKVTDAEAERRRQMSLAFIDALSRIPRFKATASLVRHAVLAAHETVRQAAGEALKSKSPHEYMPLLLAGLSEPVDTRFTINVNPFGLVSYEHVVRAEGAEADFVLAQSRTSQRRITPLAIPEPELRLLAQQRLTRDMGVFIQGHVVGYARNAKQVEDQVKSANARATKLNQRVSSVLANVTGEQLGDDPKAWYDYWQDYNEYAPPPYRPTYRYEDYNVYTYQAAPVYTYYRPYRTTSCFVAGTLVWTKTGKAPIEALREGDLVLAQDPVTGELTHRTVLQTTTREPSPTLRITVGKSELQTTLGHPFWIPGHGWKMAKELSTGDRLLTVDGPVSIESIDKSPEAEAFNLIVEGLSNYFVGADGLMVHDNSPRRPELVQAAAR